MDRQDLRCRQDRLTKKITYWDHRAEELKLSAIRQPL
jgi:hypothetical protein